MSYLLLADSHAFTCRTWDDLAAKLVLGTGGLPDGQGATGERLCGPAAVALGERAAGGGGYAASAQRPKLFAFFMVRLREIAVGYAAPEPHPPTMTRKATRAEPRVWGRFHYGEDCLPRNIPRVVRVGVLLADLPALAVNDQLAVFLLGKLAARAGSPGSECRTSLACRLRLRESRNLRVALRERRLCRASSPESSIKRGAKLVPPIRCRGP